MRPEDIDKLFKDRLGPTSPTPPADLWGRLQDRIESEVPGAQQEEKKPRGLMFLSYSIAAAIVLLLAVGVVFFNVQRGQLPTDGMASNQGQIAEQPLIISEPATTASATNQGVAQVTENDRATMTEEILPETALPAAKVPAKVEVAPKATMAKVTTKPVAKEVKKSGANATVSIPAVQLAAQVKQSVQPTVPQKGEYYNTGESMPTALAANRADMNAQPVEIIIKRAVYMEPQEEEVELSGFEKKQKLAKNIFKQVRNLSNGERVELSELGINTDRIALETQIGKQKISKVINL